MNTSALTTNGIVPEVMEKVPSKTLNISFEAGPVDMGNVFRLTQTAAVPNVTFEADPNKFYTLIHIDPDAPSRSVRFLKSFLHWLVVNIPGGDVSKGETQVRYKGPMTPPLTGLHRYIFLLYEQEDKLEECEAPTDSMPGRVRFNHHKFAKKHKLSEPIAANFFQARYTRG